MNEPPFLVHLPTYSTITDPILERHIPQRRIQNWHTLSPRSYRPRYSHRNRRRQRRHRRLRRLDRHRRRKAQPPPAIRPRRLRSGRPPCARRRHINVPPHPITGSAFRPRSLGTVPRRPPSGPLDDRGRPVRDGQTSLSCARDAPRVSRGTHSLENRCNAWQYLRLPQFSPRNPSTKY